MSQIYCNNTLINTYSIVNKKVHTIPLILRSLTFGNKDQYYWTTQFTWLGHRRVRDMLQQSIVVADYKILTTNKRFSLLKPSAHLSHTQTTPQKNSFNP